MSRTEVTIPESLTKVFHSVMKLYTDMIGEGNMTFTSSGITMSGMDQSHVCLLRTEFPSAMFQSHGGGYVYGGEDITTGVPYKILTKIIGAFSSPTHLKITVSGESDAMELEVATSDGLSRFVIKLMELEEEEMDVPEMEYDVSVDVPFKTLQKALGQAETLDATSVNLAWVPGSDENELRLYYKTDAVDADVVVNTSTTGSNEPSNVSIAASYPKRLFAAGQMSPNVSVGFSDGLPVRFQCVHDAETNGRTELYVAPRIEDDEDETNYRE